MERRYVFSYRLLSLRLTMCARLREEKRRVRMLSFQIYIAGKRNADDTIEMLNVIRERLIPGRVLLLADPEQQDNVLLRKNEVVGKLKPQKGRATVLVCRRNTCSVPITNPSELASHLDDTEFSNL